MIENNDTAARLEERTVSTNPSDPLLNFRDTRASFARLCSAELSTTRFVGREGVFALQTQDNT